MAELILHHYPPSPVSEKIRAALGLKNATWRSVEQNRLPDRPELLAMTGGYRRIPVLQVGADIYCDTQIIFRAIETQIPSPSLFPGGASGLPFGLSRWTDVELFTSAMKVAFAPEAENLPQALVADRTRLYLGPEGDLAKERADLPHILAQMRAQVGWLDDALADGRLFLLGEEPGMADLLAWTIVWFIQGRYKDAGAFLEPFPHLLAWAERMRQIGHGTPSDMSTAAALEVAKAAQPMAPATSDPGDPQGLEPGMSASVSPLTNSGETAVFGVIRSVGRDMIVLTLESEVAGTLAVHFPRVGYRVVPQSTV